MNPLRPLPTTSKRLRQLKHAICRAPAPGLPQLDHKHPPTN